MPEPSIADKLMKEAHFQEWLRDLAGRYDYLYYHTHRSIHSPSGFPDTVMVRLISKPRLVFAELKTEDMKNSQPSADQAIWLYFLQQIPGVECYMWRPSDRDDIERILE